MTVQVYCWLFQVKASTYWVEGSPGVLKKAEQRSTTVNYLESGGTCDRKVFRFGITGNNYLVNSSPVLDKLPSSPIRFLGWQDHPSFLFHMTGRRWSAHSSQAYISSVQVTLPDWIELDTPCSNYRWEADRDRDTLPLYLVIEQPSLGVREADTSGGTFVTLALLIIEIFRSYIYLSPAEGWRYVSLSLWEKSLSTVLAANLNLPWTAQLINMERPLFAIWSSGMGQTSNSPLN